MVKCQVGLLMTVSDQLSSLSSLLTHPTVVSNADVAAPDPHAVAIPSPMSIHLAQPEKFSVDLRECRPFVTQCELHFELQAQLFPTEWKKVTYVISHLTGSAEEWAMAEGTEDSAV